MQPREDSGRNIEVSNSFQPFLTFYARYVIIVLSIVSSLVLAQVSFIAAAVAFLGILLVIILMGIPVWKNLQIHISLYMLLFLIMLLPIYVCGRPPYGPLTAYFLFQAPIAPVHLKAILEQSELDERQFLVNERFSLVMVGDPLDMTGYQESIRVEEMRADDGKVTSISSENTGLVPPFTMEHGQTYLVVMTKTLTSRTKGFLVNEVRYTPSDLVYSYSDKSGQAQSNVRIALNPAHSILQPIEVELDEFPKDSFWGSNWPGEIQPYGDSVIIRWTLSDIPPGLKFLYIPRPYYSLRWLLTPVLGVTTISDALASIAGIAIPFLAGMALTAFINIFKDFVTIQIEKFKDWPHRPFQKHTQRRETLEKILPNGMSVDEYFEKEKRH